MTQRSAAQLDHLATAQCGYMGRSACTGSQMSSPISLHRIASRPLYVTERTSKGVTDRLSM